ncbi:hypothetical protein ABNQ38_33700 [Azospirillum sp. A29]|uniref:hypothetical protein n=1 Tax=Azospirillum sp. A29 TaxID=3160606 RepID=UPI00366E4B55
MKNVVGVERQGSKQLATRDSSLRKLGGTIIMAFIKDRDIIRKYIEEQIENSQKDPSGIYKPGKCDPVIYFKIQLTLGNKVAEKHEESIEKFWRMLSLRGVTHKHGTLLNSKQGIQPIKSDSSAGIKVQLLGNKHGCWTCGAKMSDNGAASWVADHIPPVKLSAAALAAVNARFGTNLQEKNYSLHPSCYDCCRKQPGLIKKLNKNPMDVAILLNTTSAQRMIMGGPCNNTVRTSSPKTLAAQGVWTNLAGVKCHICGSDAPSGKDTAYTADHYPPREFNTHYAQTLFKMIGKAIKKPQALPQCITCSNRQGDYSAVSVKMKKIATSLHVVAYK